MRHRAFTLVEVIVVVAILTVVAAVISPVLWRVKHSANMASSTVRLHQLGVAVKQYQVDYGLDGPSTYELPTYEFVYTDFFGLGKSYFESPCGYKKGIEDNLMGISYQYWAGFPMNEPFFQEHGDRSVLFSDPHCNDSADQWKSRYRSKRGIAVLYSGEVVNRYKPGNPSDMDWWSK